MYGFNVAVGGGRPVPRHVDVGHGPALSVSIDSHQRITAVAHLVNDISHMAG